jgi:hypothetical protein
MSIGSSFYPQQSCTLNHYPVPVFAPNYLIQQCPVCAGTRGDVSSWGWLDCSFCWGIGAVKVGYYSGNVEAIEPPSEPNWHRAKREALEPPAEPSEAGGEQDDG